MSEPKGRGEERVEGVVQWFSRAKGYGFIRRSDDLSQDIFVHYSDVADRQDLIDGERVSFVQEDGERGPKARGVERLR